MTPGPSRQWLDQFLSGAAPTEADLKQLVHDCPKEDQHIDYKAGKLLKAPAAADTLREYVAAFANSDGGILLIGYDQAVPDFDDAQAPGGGSIEEWAVRSLYALTPFFSPQPRILSSQLGGKTVLIVATARAPRLVPVALKRDLVYFLRIGDSNFAAPPFLVSDLVLGRRNHPVLNADLASATFSAAQDIGCPNVEGVSVTLTVTIENKSLAFAEDVRCGLITWSAPKEPPRHRDGASVPDSLRACLDVTDPRTYEPQQFQLKWRLTHVRLSRHHVAGAQADEPLLHLGPLDQTGLEALKWFTLPVFPNHLHMGPAAEAGPFADHVRQTRLQLRGAMEFKAALYALSRNAEPWWSQLTIRYDKKALQTHAKTPLKLIALAPLITPRPLVSAGFYVPDGETL